VVGDVNTKEVKKLRNFWLLAKGIAPQITYPDPKCAANSDFVDMPNAVQSEISVVNTVNLKLPTNNILLLS
jgi:hypothetical protein